MTGRIAARLPTWLGDNIMALPSLHALARASEQPLLLWGPPGMQGLMTYAGFEFDYVPYRRRRGVAGVSDALRVTNELRHRNPRTIVLFPNAFEPALLARGAGIERRVGFATDGRGRLLNDVATEPTPRFAVHESERFATLARHLDVDVDFDDHGLEPTALLRQQSDDLFGDGERFLGLVPGSANTPAKRWPAARYAELAVAAHEALGARSLLLGSDADQPVIRDIAEQAGDAVVEAGGGNLEALMAALLRCGSVVSNDTGAAHLAASLDVPTTVIFGPTDPRRSKPLGARVTAVSADTFCAPCGYDHCPLDHACMQDLTIENVLEATLPFWQESP